MLVTQMIEKREMSDKGHDRQKYIYNFFVF